MSLKTEKILKEISELSDEERENLIHEILIKHGPPPKSSDESLSELVTRRLEELKSGKVKAIPLSVIREKRAKRRQRRHESSNS